MGVAKGRVKEELRQRQVSPPDHSLFYKFLLAITPKQEMFLSYSCLVGSPCHAVSCPLCLFAFSLLPSSTLSLSRLSFPPELSSLCRELHGLMRVMWSGKWAVVTPHTILTSVWQHMPSFRGYCQQDAQEFMWSVGVFLQVIRIHCRLFAVHFSYSKIE